MKFEELKLNEAGLIPVVVQDSTTKDVLMVAYMNETAYDMTLETGIMHFYSRSRQNLWKKGETSGNYQYIKKLSIDCDQDTLLAEVSKEGPACHTGAESCFFTDIFVNELAEEDPVPADMLEYVYNTVVERRNNPKEGSYTNYLFDKGIDKILKKVGEETAEIIIASKNEGTTELIYEVSDLMYHLSVLMVEKGVTWAEIHRELSKRK